MPNRPDVDWAHVEAEIAVLRDNHALHPQQAEIALGNVLEPLLAHDGFQLEHTGGPGDLGVDFWVRPQKPETGQTFGIQAKFYRGQRPVSTQVVQQLIGAALMQGLDRMVLVTNGTFSKNTHDSVARALPVRIELLDIGSLQHWVARIRDAEPDVGTEIRTFMRELSIKLAHAIARSPDALAHIEWRDLERLVAEVFSGLGFGVTLMPGTKDGGKDVILTCNVEGKRSEYYVEIKHWRSGNRVGAGSVSKLLKVVVKEKKAGGMFLSTYGFTENAFEQNS